MNFSEANSFIFPTQKINFDLIEKLPVSKEVQLQASIETLKYAVAAYKEPEKQIFFDQMIDILLFAQASNECRENTDLCEALIASTVSLFDIFLFDEITTEKRDSSPIYNRYGRAGIAELRNLVNRKRYETKYDVRLKKFIPLQKSFFYTDEIESLFLRIRKQKDTENMLVFVDNPLEMKEKIEKGLINMTEEYPKIPKIICDKNLPDSVLNEMIKFEEMYNKHIQEVYKDNPEEIEKRLLSFLFRKDISDNVTALDIRGNYDEIIPLLLAPLTQIDIQTRSELLLKAGISLFPSTSSLTIKGKSKILYEKTPSDLLQELWELWLSIDISLLNTNEAKRHTITSSITHIFQSVSTREIQSEAEAKNLKDYYGNLLGLKESDEKVKKASNVELTRSGLSAVCCGIELASLYFDAIGKSATWFVCNGFYYEAATLVHHIATETNHPHEAIVFCVNVAPNIATMTNFASDSFLPYDAQRDLLLNGIYQKACNSTEDIFLIFDSTTNLTFSLYHGLPIPPNLHIIKACSLTKYRRGDQNHFAGVNLLYTQNDLLRSLMPKAIVNSASRVDTRNITFFLQHITNEIESSYLHFKNLQSEFIHGLEIKASYMRNTNKYWDWKIEFSKDAPQFCFLVPPMDIIIEHFLAGIDTDFEVNTTIFDENLYNKLLSFPYEPVSYTFFRYLYGFIPPIEDIAKWYRESSRVSVEYGASFGLNKTRVSYYNNPFTYNAVNYEITDLLN